MPTFSYIVFVRRMIFYIVKNIMTDVHKDWNTNKMREIKFQGFVLLFPDLGLVQDSWLPVNHCHVLPLVVSLGCQEETDIAFKAMLPIWVPMEQWRSKNEAKNECVCTIFRHYNEGNQVIKFVRCLVVN